MLDSHELDAIKELINIGMGRGAGVLNEMLKSHISLKLPTLDIITGEKLIDIISIEYSTNLSGINMKYSGDIKGDVELLFSKIDAEKLVTIFIEEGFEGSEFDEMKSSVLCEIGNIVINAVLGSLSNILGLSLKYTVPSYLEGEINAFLDHISVSPNTIILLAKTHFIINEHDISGYIMLFFSLETFIQFKDKINKFIGSIHEV